MKTALILASTAWLGLAAASPAHADQRSFTRTYEYGTLPESETELQLHTEQSRQRLGERSRQDLVLQLAIEHGITERWDVALHHVLGQSTGPAADDDQALHVDALALRSRYRLSERGDLPVDLMALAELVRGFGTGAYQAQLRAVVARDFDKLTAAINLIGDLEFGPAVDGTVLAAGWAAGLSYQVFPELALGVESWGGFAIDAPADLAASVGPAVSWAPSARLWVTTTAGFGLTDRTDDVAVRAIIGLLF